MFKVTNLASFIVMKPIAMTETDVPVPFNSFLLGNVTCVLLSAVCCFQDQFFSEIFFQEYNSLDLDQIRRFVGPRVQTFCKVHRQTRLHVVDKELRMSYLQMRKTKKFNARV